MASCLEKINLVLKTWYNAWHFIRRQNNPDQIVRVQNEKLRNLIKYSYENIKYYRELFDDHSIKPDDIETITDLPKIPILTKEDLRRRLWDFLPIKLSACKISRTSGSTGVPVCIFSDLNSRINNSAAVIRYRKQLGIDFFGKAILVPLKTENELSRTAHWTFLQGIHKAFYVNPYTNHDSDIKYARNTINKLSYPAIIGLTSAIKALAIRILDNIFPPLKPSAVLTTGEYLSNPIRKLLENAFEVKVTDIYACSEAGDVAWQCREGQCYHINADNCIVEILKDGQPIKQGDIGEVVITNLNRYSMPFIRYKNGDLAKFTPQDCQCGCKLPVFTEITGRTGDDIFLPSGKIVPWHQLNSFMNHPHIREFQIIQNTDGSLTVKFVAERNCDVDQITMLLRSRYFGLLGNSIQIEFLIVEKIDLTPSGKSKLVISNYRSIKKEH